MMCNYLLGILMVCGIACANHLTGVPVKAQLDKIFTNFVKTNEFYGAQLGVIQGSSLIYAEGRGRINGKQASPSELAPILDLSKSFTAVAVLQLIEQGMIDLDSHVFGPEGILGYMTPPQNTSEDPRLKDITVEHLLRHSAGWDETARPLLDPTKNQLLYALGYAVTDISRELGNTNGYLDQYDIIHYMTGQPLQYAPGERVCHSNLGYSILGRVIEAVTGQYYEHYVKDNILVPSGMWHTRIGQPPHNSKSTFATKDKAKYSNDEADQKVAPETLDSTLGWYSNVYDIARFFTTLYASTDIQLLRTATLNYAIQKNPELAKHRTLKWPGLGIDVQYDGSLILEGSDRDLGVSVFFYKEPLLSFFGYDDELYEYLKQANTAIIFIGFTRAHKKHLNGLHDAVLSLNLHLLNQNAYIRDLCDIELTSGKSQILTKTKLDEHKLVAFTNAMRLAGYSPRWLHGYNFEGNSYFMTIFELATESIQLHYKLMKSSSRIKVYRLVSSYTKQGYQLSLLQSLHSTSHNNHLVHFVLMKRTQQPQITMFNLGTTIETYQMELPNYLMEGYKVAVQSVERDQRQTSVSYILQRPVRRTASPSHAFENLSLDELLQKNANQNKEDYYLSYLDTFVEHTHSKFSAIFQHQESTKHYIFQTDIRSDGFISEAFDKSGQNYLPDVAVAYVRDDVLYFAVQWAKQ